MSSQMSELNIKTRRGVCCLVVFIHLESHWGISALKSRLFCFPLYAAFSLINDISVGRSALIMWVFPQIKRQDFKSLERRPVISQTRDGLRGDGRRIVRWEWGKEYEMPVLSMICTAAMLRKNFDTLVCAVLNWFQNLATGYNPNHIIENLKRPCN